MAEKPENEKFCDYCKVKIQSVNYKIYMDGTISCVECWKKGVYISKKRAEGRE